MLRQTIAKFLGRSGFRVDRLSRRPGAATALTERETASPSLLVLAARVLDASTVALAHRLRALAPAVPMLGIADQVGLAEEPSAGLPDDLRFLAPLRSARRAARRSLVAVRVPPERRTDLREP